VPDVQLQPNPETTSVRRRQAMPKPVDPLRSGLPADLTAERFVLAVVLQDGSRFPEIAELLPENFSIEKHGCIFRRMRDLAHRNEPIDYVTVAHELELNHELDLVPMSELVSLENDMPHLPNLGAYVRIVRDKSLLRQSIYAAETFQKQALLQQAPTIELLDGLSARIDQLRADCVGGDTNIRRIEDLDSIFADRKPTNYLINPELPEKAVVCLTGDSESGKTTVACAWARDLMSKGHPILILDRDKNPRDRICDRLERLGVKADGRLLRVWDCEQNEEPPQPNDPRVVDWVKRMVAESGKSPIVVVDSLVSFFLQDEDENSAVDMRAVFDRCRAVTRVGGTVIVIHHTNRSGQARGSSDFKPASDQAFLVSNTDGNGGRLLDRITLTFEKSRYGHSGHMRYDYAGGRMARLEDHTRIETVTEKLSKILRDNPGIPTEGFVKAAADGAVARERAREFLNRGVESGTIRMEQKGRAKRHWLEKADDRDEDRAPRSLYQ
jgi:hypothetical protein